VNTAMRLGSLRTWDFLTGWVAITVSITTLYHASWRNSCYGGIGEPKRLHHSFLV
jgi:hypothetical protein